MSAEAARGRACGMNKRKGLATYCAKRGRLYSFCLATGSTRHMAHMGSAYDPSNRPQGAGLVPAPRDFFGREGGGEKGRGTP